VIKRINPSGIISLPVIHSSKPDFQPRNLKIRLAIVYAEGDIVVVRSVQQGSGVTPLKRPGEVRQDEDVKAVVLRINSPGGSVTGSERIQREVVLTHKEKPVIVSMGDYAASGGYWIATGADHIFAEPNTITGSIGVFGLQFNIQKLGY
jgi:protease-4